MHFAHFVRFFLSFVELGAQAWVWRIWICGSMVWSRESLCFKPYASDDCSFGSCLISVVTEDASRIESYRVPEESDKEPTPQQHQVLPKCIFRQISTAGGAIFIYKHLQSNHVTAWNFAIALLRDSCGQVLICACCVSGLDCATRAMRWFVKIGFLCARRLNQQCDMITLSRSFKSVNANFHRRLPHGVPVTSCKYSLQSVFCCVRMQSKHLYGVHKHGTDSHNSCCSFFPRALAIEPCTILKDQAEEEMKQITYEKGKILLWCLKKRFQPTVEISRVFLHGLTFDQMPGANVSNHVRSVVFVKCIESFCA